MSRNIEEALAKSLEMVEAGEATPEEILGLYPELRAELEPLLALSAELRAMPKVEAPARLRGYRRPVFRPAPVKEPGWRRLLPQFGPSLRWATPLAQAAAAIAVLFAAAGGTMVASANSLPDDALYPVKLAVEDARLALAPNDSARAALELSFAARRLDEVERAAALGRTDAVAKGAGLYEERAAAARNTAESTSTGTEETAVGETLRQNQEALGKVLAKLQDEDRNAGNSADHSNAVEAISRVLAASQGSEHGGKAEAKDKKTPGPAAPAVVTSPTAAATTVPTATATAVPEPTPGHEPPGKVKPKAEQTGAPQAEQHGEGSDQRANPDHPVGASESAAPRGPDAQAGNGGQGADAGKSNGSTATPTATTTESGGVKKGNEGKPNFLDDIVSGIRGFVTRK